MIKLILLKEDNIAIHEPKGTVIDHLDADTFEGVETLKHFVVVVVSYADELDQTIKDAIEGTARVDVDRFINDFGSSSKVKKSIFDEYLIYA